MCQRHRQHEVEQAGEHQGGRIARVAKTAPQWSGITPRWLVALLAWVPVEAGTYRVNRVRENDEGADDGVECSPTEESDLPGTFVDYEEQPRGYTLNAISTVVDVQTRVPDPFSSPHDQIREQLDGRQLYLQAKTAGTLYQMALRHELRPLGLRFVLRDNGLCELADVPRRVLTG